MKIKLAEQYARALTQQDYGPQPEIEGVSLTPLKKHRAVEGSFMEYLRLTGSGVAEGVGDGFQVRLRAAFRAIAAAEPGRCFLVDAGKPPEAVAAQVWAVVAPRLAPRPGLAP